MWHDNLIIVSICISLSDVERLCMFLLAMSSLEKYLFSFLPIFYWVVCFLLWSYMSYFCILEVKPLSVALFANIFSHSIGCHFVYGFLCYAKLLSLIRSQLFIFAFISVALGDWLKKFLLQLLSEDVLPAFFSRNFMVSCFTFRSIVVFLAE